MMGLLIGILIGATAVGIYDIVANHMQRSRARVMSMYLNPGYAMHNALPGGVIHTLCTPSRDGVLTQDRYEYWREKSEEAWSERAEAVTELRECLDMPSLPVPDPIPAPEIFVKMEYQSEDGMKEVEGD